MLIILLLVLIGSSWAFENVEITEPVDGATYDGDWLSVRAIVENDNELPDSVHYSLNEDPVILIPRLNTDWYTYMQNDLHHGYSESPAPTDNTVFWTAPITGTEHEFPTPVVVEGLVYYPQNANGDTLFALDAATGDVEWMFTGTGSTDDAVTVKDGRLYIASDSIYCLDALTGERIWSFGEANGSGSTPAVVDGKVYCAYRGIVPDSSGIFCLDALTGSLLWSNNIFSSTVSCMTVWNGMLFVPTTYLGAGKIGALNALDMYTGEYLWQNTCSNYGYWDSSPVIVDDIIYINDMLEKTIAMDALTGQTIWEQATGGGTATIACHENRLYFGTESRPYYCLNALNGTTIWTSPYSQHGSSGIADGMIFFGEFSFNDSARVIALDCAAGDTVWTYRTTANAFYGSPSITDGIVYIPAIDGNLYAFGTGLKYTYLDDLFAQVGANELIVTSFDEGIAVAADTINFTVTGTGINLEPSYLLDLCTCPNPFSSSLSISYDLPEPTQVELSVYDLTGRLIESLESGSISAGEHILTWNPGPSQPVGCYLIVLDACGERTVRRAVLLR